MQANLDFNFPGDMAPISIDLAGNLLPEKHEKKIIIDADTLIFAACSVCQEQVDDGDNTIDLDMAYSHAFDKLRYILDRIGGTLDNTELHFTGGRASFRYQLLEEVFQDDPAMWYKAKRKSEAPAGLRELKLRFVKDNGAMIHYEYEADDYVVYRKKQLGDSAILVAVDKDVIHNTVGTHWNYYDNPRFNKQMKWVEVDNDSASYHQYLQVITGDKSDNVPGIHGIGPAKASKFLEMGMNESELWDGVMSAYGRNCKYGDPIDMAILNMRLVNMHQLTDKGIKLWTPPN